MIKLEVFELPPTITTVTPVQVAKGPCRVKLYAFGGGFVVGDSAVTPIGGLKPGILLTDTSELVLTSADKLYAVQSSTDRTDPKNISVLTYGV